MQEQVPLTDSRLEWAQALIGEAQRVEDHEYAQSLLRRSVAYVNDVLGEF